MNRAALPAVINHIHRLRQPAGSLDLTDRQLLGRFVSERDEGAFAALVDRHGPLVLGVCRRLLRHEEAEDAFQGTFLVLARKAARLGWRDSVAGFFHEVAVRITRKVRTQTARRQLRETPLSELADVPVKDDRAAQELAALFDEELMRLPERYRGPLLLCYLEGQTRDQAAARLGLSLRTLERRLQNGRELLRDRLAHRGVSLAAVLVTATASVATAVPATLAATTVRAILLPATTAATPFTLAEAVLHSTVGGRWKAVLALALGLLLLAGSAVGLVHLNAQVQPEPATPRAEAQRAPGQPGPPPEARQPAVDRQGDPLPERVILRLGTIRFRHPGSISAVAVSPDGKRLATAIFRMHEVLLWDVKTGKRLGRGAHKHAFSVVFTPDGRTLISVGWDRSLRWWGGADLKPEGSVTLPNPGDRTPGLDPRLHSVACSPDGRRLATIDLAGSIAVWDATTRKVLHSFPAASGQCNIAFSPNGLWLTVGGYEGQLTFREARTGEPVLKLPGHPARIRSVAFDPTGRTLLTGADDNTGLVWDLRPKTDPKDNLGVPALWEILAGKDGSAAYRAIWTLADRPDRSIPFLKEKLTPTKPIDPVRLRRLLDNLDSDNFADRDAASKELAAGGEAAEIELRRELTRTTSAEARDRLRTLLDGFAMKTSAETVRQERAVAVLMWVNTAESRRLLERLAQGAPDAVLTRQVRIALRHLEGR